MSWTRRACVTKVSATSRTNIEVFCSSLPKTKSEATWLCPDKLNMKQKKQRKLFLLCEYWCNSQTAQAGETIYTLTAFVWILMEQPNGTCKWNCLHIDYIFRSACILSSVSLFCLWTDCKLAAAGLICIVLYLLVSARYTFTWMFGVQTSVQHLIAVTFLQQVWHKDNFPVIVSWNIGIVCVRVCAHAYVCV